MPELPEVEVVRHGLQPAITGSLVESVSVLEPRSLRRHLGGGTDFIDRLQGKTMLAAVRRGKFLWFPLADAEYPKGNGEALLAHLGMSGQLLLRERGADIDRLTRIQLQIQHPESGPFAINFVDQRIFGSLAIDLLEPLDAPGGFSGEAQAFSENTLSNSIPSQVAHISRDLLDPFFDDALFMAKLAKKRTEIKRALLDQQLISGIGNIYADEALWMSGLHYQRSSQSLSSAEVAALLQALRDVLAKALHEGGTSFDSQYLNVNGEAGYFAHSLNAYGQQGKACSRCGTTIVRESFMNRGSHFCPNCQPQP